MNGKRKIQYGKLINDKLYAFPGFVTEEGRVIYNPPENIIRKHGFKKVLSFEAELEQGPFDKLIWKENREYSFCSVEVILLLLLYMDYEI